MYRLGAGGTQPSNMQTAKLDTYRTNLAETESALASKAGRKKQRGSSRNKESASEVAPACHKKSSDLGTEFKGRKLLLKARDQKAPGSWSSGMFIHIRSISASPYVQDFFRIAGLTADI